MKKERALLHVMPAACPHTSTIPKMQYTYSSTFKNGKERALLHVMPAACPTHTLATPNVQYTYTVARLRMEKGIFYVFFMLFGASTYHD
jgi:hypothetical protein